MTEVCPSEGVIFRGKITQVEALHTLRMNKCTSVEKDTFYCASIGEIQKRPSVTHCLLTVIKISEVAFRDMFRASSITRA
jgi:hypothetical protein